MLLTKEYDVFIFFLPKEVKWAVLVVVLGQKLLHFTAG